MLLSQGYLFSAKAFEELIEVAPFAHVFSPSFKDQIFTIGYLIYQYFFYVKFRILVGILMSPLCKAFLDFNTSTSMFPRPAVLYHLHFHTLEYGSGGGFGLVFCRRLFV